MSGSETTKTPFQLLYRAKDKKENTETKNAYVFAVFNEPSYSLGAMTCAHSIKLTGTEAHVVCMVTKDIPSSYLELMKGVFDRIFEVPYLKAHTIPLRTEKQRTMYKAWIRIGFTKWNCLALTDYEKVVFLDADKVVLRKMDTLFEMPTPAGTFSSPHGEGYCVRPGIHNPYFKLKHGETVPRNAIEEGLSGQRDPKTNKVKSSFTVIGTSVVLSPNIEHYEWAQKALRIFGEKNPFGFPYCNSMMDEQFLCFFYHDYLPSKTNKNFDWTYVSQKYNWILWDKHWLRKEEFPPYVLHFFGIKPWILKRYDWLDLEVWWDFVATMIERSSTGSSLSKLFRSEQLDLTPQKGCFYCKLYGEQCWTGHNFMKKGKMQCPRYKGELEKEGTSDQL